MPRRSESSRYQRQQWLLKETHLTERSNFISQLSFVAFSLVNLLYLPVRASKCILSFFRFRFLNFFLRLRGIFLRTSFFSPRTEPGSHCPNLISTLELTSRAPACQLRWWRLHSTPIRSHVCTSRVRSALQLDVEIVKATKILARRSCRAAFRCFVFSEFLAIHS